jgi:hypothetical protein
MVPKIPPVGADAMLVEIVRPNRIEHMSAHLRETESHPPGPGEHINHPEPFVLANEYSFASCIVNLLFLANKPLRFIFIFVSQVSSCVFLIPVGSHNLIISEFNARCQMSNLEINSAQSGIGAQNPFLG